MPRFRKIATLAATALLTASVAAVAPLASSVSAATFNVTVTNDSGPGSLRQALDRRGGERG